MPTVHRGGNAHAHPKISVDGAAGVLIADVTSKSLDDGELVSYPDVEFAALDFTDVSWAVDADGVLVVSDVPATLTADGVPAFADFYEIGDDLDPVSFTLGTSDVPEPDDDPPGNAGDDPDGEDTGTTPPSTADGAGNSSSGGSLPKTGAEWAMAALAGLGLLGAGSGISVAARRRRLVESGS